MILFGEVVEGWTGPLGMATMWVDWTVGGWEEEEGWEWPGREIEEGAEGLGPDELERWREGPPLSWSGENTHFTHKSNCLNTRSSLSHKHSLTPFLLSSYKTSTQIILECWRVTYTSTLYRARSGWSLPLYWLVVSLPVIGAGGRTSCWGDWVCVVIIHDHLQFTVTLLSIAVLLPGSFYPGCWPMASVVAHRWWPWPVRRTTRRSPNLTKTQN